MLIFTWAQLCFGCYQPYQEWDIKILYKDFLYTNISKKKLLIWTEFINSVFQKL
jgi:hypothetical protein